MIIRVVKLEIKDEHIAQFLSIFSDVKSMIVDFEGCSHVELWQDVNDPGRVFTYSHWESTEHLDKYRYSDLFRTTWAQTKQLFRAKAIAWSVTKKEQA